jgi:cytochrome c553
MLAGILGGFALRVLADEPDPEARRYAQRLAVAVCGTCHGTRGNSEQPKFPRLAGQNTNYLTAQLKNFRGQTRGDPDAISYMWGMAGPLSDETIGALAQYCSTSARRHGRSPARRRSRAVATSMSTVSSPKGCLLARPVMDRTRMGSPTFRG